MATRERTYMLDLTNAGSRVSIDVSAVNRLSISTAMASLMGTGVIEIQLAVNGVPKAFSPAKVLSASVDLVDLDVDGYDEVILIVATADSSAQEIVVSAYAEATGF